MNGSTSVRVPGIVNIVAGILLVVVGGVVWGFTASQLSAQQITVPDDARYLAGTAVNNPLAALAQAQTIAEHQQHGALETLEENKDLLSSVGITVDPDATYNYSTLGPVKRAVTAGIADGTLDNEEAAPLLALRDTANEAAGLQAGLFTSVIAFGVSALIMGLGILTVINGFALTRIAAATPTAARTPELATATA